MVAGQQASKGSTSTSPRSVLDGLLELTKCSHELRQEQPEVRVALLCVSVCVCVLLCVYCTLCVYDILYVFFVCLTHCVCMTHCVFYTLYVYYTLCVLYTVRV